MRLDRYKMSRRHINLPCLRLNCRCHDCGCWQPQWEECYWSDFHCWITILMLIEPFRLWNLYFFESKVSNGFRNNTHITHHDDRNITNNAVIPMSVVCSGCYRYDRDWIQPPPSDCSGLISSGVEALRRGSGIFWRTMTEILLHCRRYSPYGAYCDDIRSWNCMKPQSL